MLLLCPPPTGTLGLLPALAPAAALALRHDLCGARGALAAAQAAALAAQTCLGLLFSAEPSRHIYTTAPSPPPVRCRCRGRPLSARLQRSAAQAGRRCFAALFCLLPCDCIRLLACA